MKATNYKVGFRNISKDTIIEGENLFNSGFQLTFANGITISVAFGHANYCSNYFKSKHKCVDKDGYVISKDAEVLIFDEMNGLNITPMFIDCEDDSVKANCTPEEVAKLMKAASESSMRTPEIVQTYPERIRKGLSK